MNDYKVNSYLFKKLRLILYNWVNLIDLNSTFLKIKIYINFIKHGFNQLKSISQYHSKITPIAIKFTFLLKKGNRKHQQNLLVNKKYFILILGTSKSMQKIQWS